MADAQVTGPSSNADDQNKTVAKSESICNDGAATADLGQPDGDIPIGSVSVMNEDRSTGK